MKLEAIEGTVPAVFSSKADAEAALNELRSMGFGHDDLGVIVPDPAHFHLIDESGKETWHGLYGGTIAGIPIGALAGMAMTALIIPGLGVLGVGGALLVGGVGGAMWGAYLGSITGIAAEIMHVDDIERRYQIPLQKDEILVVVLANETAPEVCAVLERHNARCIRETTKVAAVS